MATIAQDTFTEAVDTQLDSHTPDIGTAWQVDANSVGLDVIAAEDTCIHNQTSTIKSAKETTTIGDDDMDVSLDVQGQINTNYGGPCARIPTGAPDGQNMYMGRLIFDVEESGQLEIIKIVAGTITVLGSFTLNQAANTFITLKLEIRAGEQKLFAAGTLRITTNESDTTLQGNNFAGLRSLSTTANMTFDNYLSESVAAIGGYPSGYSDPSRLMSNPSIM